MADLKLSPNRRQELPQIEANGEIFSLSKDKGSFEFRLSDNHLKTFLAIIAACVTFLAGDKAKTYFLGDSTQKPIEVRLERLESDMGLIKKALKVED